MIAHTTSNMSKTTLQYDKQCRPWSDCSFGSSLIWVCIVCSDFFSWSIIGVGRFWILRGQGSEYLRGWGGEGGDAKFSLAVNWSEPLPPNNYISHIENWWGGGGGGGLRVCWPPSKIIGGLVTHPPPPPPLPSPFLCLWVFRLNMTCSLVGFLMFKLNCWLGKTVWLC